MKPGLLVGVLLAITSIEGMAQRGHEIQFQTGYLRNWGVKFYDFRESELRRHNYEFDHVYDADLLSLAWHYPINSYIDLGLNYTQSYDSSLELIQAESALFDQNAGEGPQRGVIFAGLTDAEARYLSVGITLRINHLIRSNKYKYYLILNPVYQSMEASFEANDTFETENQGLREAITGDFSRKENSIAAGLGFGISYPLKNGINLKILEVYDRYTFKGDLRNLLSQKHSIEIRTGISYQFFRKK